MAAISGRDKVCGDICTALGLKRCSMLNIHMSKNSVVTVVARYYPDQEDLSRLIPIIKRFNLMEKK